MTSGTHQVAEERRSLLEFPCEFPLKVFGFHSVDFEQKVLEILVPRCPQTEHFDIRQNQSKKGKYIALTITFTAYSQQQLDDIYQDLYDSEDVVMTL